MESLIWVNTTEFKVFEQFFFYSLRKKGYKLKLMLINGGGLVQIWNEFDKCQQQQQRESSSKYRDLFATETCSYDEIYNALAQAHKAIKIHWGCILQSLLRNAFFSFDVSTITCSMRISPAFILCVFSSFKIHDYSFFCSLRWCLRCIFHPNL